MIAGQINNTSEDQNHSIGANPVYAIILTILIAVLMVSVSFVIFINSSAYETVKQIKAGTSAASKNDLKAYDTTSPIKSDELDKYIDSLNQRLNNLDDEADFGQSGISSQNLGL